MVAELLNIGYESNDTVNEIETIPVTDIDINEAFEITEAFERYEITEFTIDVLDNLKEPTAGYEYMLTNLKLLGVDPKNIKVGYEADKMSFFQKLKVKIVTAARKAWEFIKDLINKIVDFFKKLFKKRIDTAHKALEIINELKDKNKTELVKTEFDEEIKQKINKLLPTQAALFNVINANSLDFYVTYMEKGFDLKRFDNNLNFIQYVHGLLAKDAEEFTKLFPNANKLNEIVNKWLNGYLISNMNEILVNFLNSIKDSTISILPDFKKVEPLISKQLMANNINIGDTGKLEIIGLRDNSITFNCIYVSDVSKLEKLISELQEKYQKVKELAYNKITASIKVPEELFTGLDLKLREVRSLVKVERITIFTDTLKLQTDVKPSNFQELEKFVMDYVRVTESALNFLENYKKKMKEFDKTIKAIQAFDRVMEAVAKQNKLGEGFKAFFKAGNLFATLFTIVDRFISKPFRSSIIGASNTAYGLVKSNMHQYVIENAKLFDVKVNLNNGLPYKED